MYNKIKYASFNVVVSSEEQILGMRCDWDNDASDSWQSHTNVRPTCVSWSLSGHSRDHSRPIRCQYPGQMIILDQSEASIQIKCSFLTNPSPARSTTLSSLNALSSSSDSVLNSYSSLKTHESENKPSIKTQDDPHQPKRMTSWMSSTLTINALKLVQFHSSFRP